MSFSSGLDLLTISWLIKGKGKFWKKISYPTFITLPNHFHQLVGSRDFGRTGL